MPKQKVYCSWCGKDDLLRWPINPNTGKPIENFFCDNRCKGAWQIAQRESLGFTKEWLIEQYVHQGKDANQIGREIGRDGKSVWNWLEQYGIQKRSRGYNYRKNFILDGSAFKGKRHSGESKEKIRQARMQDGRVPYLKNGQHWLKSVGKENHPNWRGGISPERQAVYSSPEWVEAVKAVWKRDNATCQHCGKHHNETENRGTFHIHHVASFQIRELRTNPKNLVLLCNECHKFVHSKENISRIFIKEVENG